MVVVFGLGNPGKEYQFTRHNMGFWLIDRLRLRLNLPEVPRQKFHAEIWQNQQILLGKPSTFMNRSGESVREAIDFYHLREESDWGQRVWVAHDDLDLEVGQYKIQFGKGPKIHNGLRSIDAQLGTDAYWRIRIGVDGRNGQRIIPSDQYVLSSFSPVEQEQVEKALGAAVAELIERLDVKG